ncbi:MAG: apolipoprotein N-acyltransferase [Acidobacteria bacterium]|nr:apolipoprotein N-acyltransferase [Acidobacteriota bacterium]
MSNFPAAAGRLSWKRLQPGRSGPEDGGQRRLALAAALSGFLLASAFPHFDWSFPAFFALAPLFYLLERARGKQLFLLPWASLTLFFLLLLYWIPRVMVVYGGLSWVASLLLYLLLCLALALFYLPAVVCFAFMRVVRPWLAYLAFPLAWVTCDLLRNFWMVNGFPWGAVGYSQIDRLWAQVADLGGIYLVTFLVVAVNAAVAYAWLYRSPAVPAAAAVGILTLAGMYGWQKIREDSLPSTLRVGIVQPLIEMNLSGAALRGKYLEEIPAAVEELASQGARLIVVPEAPTEFDYYGDPPFRETMQRLAAQNQVALIFNNTTLADSGGYYNSMIFLRPDGLPAGRYDKIHLVPFGEYVPGGRWLRFVRPLVQEVSSFSPGAGIRVVSQGGVRIGGFICYEAVFPELVRQFAATGAELLVNITNDGWYGKSAAAAQHLQMARMRAIETRRFLVRAANSGISAVVEPTGRVQRQLGIFQQGAFVAEIRPLQMQSFYVSRGDLFARACALSLAAGLIVVRFYRRWKIDR